MGHEYRHGMIRATLTALPNRLTVLAAKVLVAAVIAGIAAVVCVLIALLAAQLFGVGMPTGDGFWGMTAGTVIYTMLFSVSGLAFAAITRNQTAAVALLLLVPTVIEAIIGAVVLAIKFGSDDPRAEGGSPSCSSSCPTTRVARCTRACRSIVLWRSSASSRSGRWAAVW